MAIAHDADSNSTWQNASISSFSWFHTCTGSNLFLAVDVMIAVGGALTVSSITYNGVNLSRVGSQAVGSGRELEAWGLAGPATGLNTLTVNLSSAAVSVGAGATSYTGVNQSTPTEGFNSTSGTAVGGTDTLSVTTSTNNDWVHAALGNVTNASATPGQTGRNSLNGTVSGGLDTEDTNAPVSPPGVQNMTFSGITGAYGIVGYGIVPVSIFPGEDEAEQLPYPTTWW